jgi:hypothetical protein
MIPLHCLKCDSHGNPYVSSVLKSNAKLMKITSHYCDFSAAYKSPNGMGFDFQYVNSDQWMWKSRGTWTLTERGGFLLEFVRSTDPHATPWSYNKGESSSRIQVRGFHVVDGSLAKHKNYGGCSLALVRGKVECPWSPTPIIPLFPQWSEEQVVSHYLDRGYAYTGQDSGMPVFE